MGGGGLFTARFDNWENSNNNKSPQCSFGERYYNEKNPSLNQSKHFYSHSRQSPKAISSQLPGYFPHQMLAYYSAIALACDSPTISVFVLVTNG